LRKSGRPDPLVALAARFRRDGLTETEVNELLAKAGTVIAASAEADGSDRAVRAAVAAVSQLPADQFKRARGILVDVVGPDDLTLPEVDAAAGAVQQAAGADGEVLYSEIRDEGMEGAVRVTVIACSLE
jgi:cell division protein FtsZ